MTMDKKIGKKGVARRAAINVGDSVKIKFGNFDIVGTIIEDRGKIGYQGRNLYRIVMPMEDQEPMYIELPTDEIRIYRRASIAKKPVAPRTVKAKTIRVKPQPKKDADGV